MGEEPAFEVEPLDTPRSFRLRGTFGVASAGSLHELLDEVCRTGGDLTLDLSGVTFMDSVGLRAIIQACMGLADTGTVRLVNPAGQVRRLLQVSGIEGKIANLVIVEA